VERVLASLVRKELLLPEQTRLRGDEAYRFRHLLIRDAAYEALPRTSRANLHERLAAWLDGWGDALAEPDEIVGYHLEQAYRYGAELGRASDAPTRALGESAARRLVAAGRRATSHSDYHAVTTLLERALGLGLLEGAERVEADVVYGNALSQMPRVTEAEVVLTQAHEAAVGLGLRGLAAWALIQRGWNRTGRSSAFGDSEAMCLEAIEAFTELGDERGLVEARRLYGVTLINKGSAWDAGAELKRALAHAETCGDPELRRRATHTLANMFLCQGPPHVDEAAARSEELLAAAQGDSLLEATIERPLALLRAMAGRPAEATELLRRSSAILDEMKFRAMQVYRHLVAHTLELCGDLAGAERELAGQWSYFDELNGGAFDTRAWTARAELARLYCDQGRWTEAAEQLDYGNRQRDEHRSDTLGLATAGRIAAHQGRSEEATILAERAIGASERLSPRSAAAVWLAVAEVEASSGRPPDRALANAVALYEKKGDVAGAAAARAKAARFGAPSR
jgi:hypothetical protein